MNGRYADETFGDGPNLRGSCTNRCSGLSHCRDGNPQRMGAALTYARRYALLRSAGQQPAVSSTFPPPPRESGNGRLRGATKSNHH